MRTGNQRWRALIKEKMGSVCLVVDADEENVFGVKTPPACEELFSTFRNAEGRNLTLSKP